MKKKDKDKQNAQIRDRRLIVPTQPFGSTIRWFFQPPLVGLSTISWHKGHLEVPGRSLMHWSCILWISRRSLWTASPHLSHATYPIFASHSSEIWWRNIERALTQFINRWTHPKDANWMQQLPVPECIVDILLESGMLSNNVCRADRERCCCMTNRRMSIVIHCPTDRQPNSNWNFFLIDHCMRSIDSELLFAHSNRRWNFVRRSVQSHSYFSARFSLDCPRCLMCHFWNWILC